MRARRPPQRRVIPVFRGGRIVRTGALVAGLFAFACGIVGLLESNLGLSPWDVLHQGLARHTALSFGTANVVVSVVVVTLGWLLGARLGAGTVANAILVGAFVEALTAVDAIARLDAAHLTIRVLLLVGGLVLTALGTALYLGAGLGAGPRDSLMVVGAERLGMRVGVVRSALELSALGGGVALGGTVGIGTVAFALGIGPAAEGCFSLLERSPLVRRDTVESDSGRQGAREALLASATETT